MMLYCRTGTAAQIRSQVSTAFSSVDGALGRAVAFPTQGTGTLMLTQALTSAGIGSANPILVGNIHQNSFPKPTAILK